MIEEKNDKLYLNVIVVPKSSNNQVVGAYNNSLKIKVVAAPEKGKANAAVIEVIMDYFHIKKSQIQLISGETSRNKVFTLDLTLVEAQEVLEKNNVEYHKHQ
jgi:hypothetical protein